MIFRTWCQENQINGWQNTVSQPPARPKKDVLKFRSVSYTLIEPAKTERANNSKTAVIEIGQTIRGIWYKIRPGFCLFNKITVKFLALKIENATAKWKLNMAISILAPEWFWKMLREEYIIQPVSSSTLAKEENESRHKERCSNKIRMVLNLGKAISRLPAIIGTNHIPNLPIKISITIKNNITINASLLKHCIVDDFLIIHCLLIETALSWWAVPMPPRFAEKIHLGTHYIDINI